MEQTDKILITGAAGFIGSYLAEKLLKEQFQVIGIDNLNDYYDVRLKEERLKKLDGYTNFKFIRMDIADAAAMKALFESEKPDIVVNLAAQAGVRYSITNPDAYIQSNLIGFYNVLECCRHSYDNGNTGVKHLVFASSSSVYGANKKYLTAQRIRWITRFPYMLRPKNQMSCWRILTESCMAFRLQDFVSLQCMAPWEDRTWRISDSRIRW